MCGIVSVQLEVIKNITDPDYCRHKIEILRFLDRPAEALEVIFSDKDCRKEADLYVNCVNEILRKDQDGSLKRKVEELVKQFGELKIE